MFHPSRVERPSLVITSNSVLVMALWQAEGRRTKVLGTWTQMLRVRRQRA